MYTSTSCISEGIVPVKEAHIDTTQTEAETNQRRETKEGYTYSMKVMTQQHLLRKTQNINLTCIKRNMQAMITKICL